MRTIALEEHFCSPELADPPGSARNVFYGQRVTDQLGDLDKVRLAEMDAAGIDVQVISHVAPAAQGLANGVGAAQRANDQLAIAVASHPDRFAGFATLPTGDPSAAADELERAVGDLGLVGALVNSTLGPNGVFLDDPRFEPLLDRFELLDVPLYLHPAPPPPALSDILYGGLPPLIAARLATGAWGWHAEAGLHALRMVVAGVFDRHPGLRMILGHCGEMIPFMLDRIDEQLHGQLRHEPSEYFLRNVWVTTAGMFSVPPVMCSVQVFGVDRVLFSVDYPFGSNTRGRALLDTLPLSVADKAKIAGGNAERLLGLDLSSAPTEARRSGGAELPGPGGLPENLIAECVVDRDHRAVGFGIPRDDVQQSRFGLGQQVLHGHLQQQPQPVPAVRPQHCRQPLEPPFRPTGIEVYLGQADELAGGIVTRRDGITAHFLLLAAAVQVADALGIPPDRLPALGVRRVVERGADPGHLLQVLLRRGQLPGHDRVPI